MCGVENRFKMVPFLGLTGESHCYVQSQQPNTTSIASMLKRTMKVHSELIEDSLEPSQQQALKSFIEQAPHLQKYAPQSGEIFGILKTMKETYETNLAKTRADEASAQKMFDELVPPAAVGDTF